MRPRTATACPAPRGSVRWASANEARIDQGGLLLLTDRHGAALYQAPGAGGRPGRESWASLDELNPVAGLTLLASEDKAIYGHAGVDPGIVDTDKGLPCRTDQPILSRPKEVRHPWTSETSGFAA